MTTITYSYLDRAWTLTDTSSQSSYGEPCLVSDANETFRATEAVIANYIDPEFSGSDTIFAGVFAPRTVTALDVIQYGSREEIPSDQWPAAHRMIHRFMRQVPSLNAHVDDFNRRFNADH